MELPRKIAESVELDFNRRFFMSDGSAFAYQYHQHGGLEIDASNQLSGDTNPVRLLKPESQV